MFLVWIAFTVSAIVVALIGLRLRRTQGSNAEALQASGAWVLGLAAGTFVHPAFLEPLGPVPWAALYAAEAVALAGIATRAGLKGARHSARA